MKAIINGISIEGTPQEVAQYQKEMDDMRRKGVYIKPPLGKAPEWIKQSKCTNEGKPCYCTGECMGTGSADINYTWGKRIYDNSIMNKGG